jgi:hypothetical protein
MACTRAERLLPLASKSAVVLVVEIKTAFRFFATLAFAATTLNDLRFQFSPIMAVDVSTVTLAPRLSTPPSTP